MDCGSSWRLVPIRLVETYADLANLIWLGRYGGTCFNFESAHTK